MTSLPGIPPLTQEQLDILETCPSPQQTSVRKGQLTRITAAAGAGKTTTLLALAIRAIQRGHTHITYVTFTKAAATDGKERLQKVLSKIIETESVLIDAQTLHSCAYRNLQTHIEKREKPNSSVTKTNKLWTEKALKRWVSEKCYAEITTFLIHLDRGRNHGNDRERAAREQVEFFIYKSLIHYCQSDWTLKQYMQEQPFGRDYYPAKIFHQSKKGQSYGFDPRMYSNRIQFYGDQAGRLFELALCNDILCFDFIMKRAQLLRLRVPGTLLLVDESQDMDACQVDWIAKQQVQFGTHVYVVGDPAQAIYGFRGAKPRFLMSLPSDVDKMLTETWRFGPNISRVANLILFAKEKSDQTERTYDGRYKHWIPYRTKPGIVDKPGKITTRSLVDDWRTIKVTAIARQNASLLLVALGVLGFVFEEQDDDNGDRLEEEDNQAALLPGIHPPVHRLGEEQPDPRLVVITPDSEDEDHVGDTGPYPDELPKIHINGRGEGSGLRLWRRSLKLIKSVYELYVAGPASSIQLDPLLFPEFVNKGVSFQSFCEECGAKDLTQYSNVITVVMNCKERTMEAIDLFKNQVMERHFSAADADIILSTCHSAKGMEWENVQVYNDFEPLCCFKRKQAAVRQPASAAISQDDADCSPSKKTRIDDSWQFGFPGWTDDLNLAYVACTRAKKTLSVPPCIYELPKMLDEAHQWNFGRNDDRQTTLFIKGCKDRLTPDDVDEFKRCLVNPLRAECDIVGTDLLAPALIEFETEGVGIQEDQL